MDVSDARSSADEQIAHAAKTLGKSKDRRKVFTAICRGKKQIKTVSEIRKMTGLDRIRILQEAKILVNNKIVSQDKLNGETAYKKDSFYAQNKAKVLSLVTNPEKLKSFPTKRTPRPIGSTVIKFEIPLRKVQIKQITVDDIDSFSKVKKKKASGSQSSMLESRFKTGIKRILHEKGKFIDWGGERNDLLTTRLRLNSKRVAAAFAFKGRALKGKLMPRAMGKHGDQIQRLFRSPAQVFLIQCWNQIDESVIEQMHDQAVVKSYADGTKIYYGVIDGPDSNRIVIAYKRYFQ